MAVLDLGRPDDSVWRLTAPEMEAASSLLTKAMAAQATSARFALVDMNGLRGLLADDEVAVAEKYLAIDARAAGITLPYLGLEDGMSGDIVAVPAQRHRYDGQPTTIPRQYLPAGTYQAYVRLNDAIDEDIGRQLLVLYGYRSVARQVVMFFDILANEYAYDVDKAMHHVCFPAYSEHVFSGRQAIDFMTEDGVCRGFETTEEYRWLRANAGDFGFVESYPEDNPWGMTYEPWHWRHERGS